MNVLKLVWGSVPDSSTPNSGPVLVIDFNDFWLMYPKKQAKVDAQKAWKRIDSNEHIDILAGVLAWRPVWRERDSDFQYAPLPATFLRGRRWEDEVPPSFVSAMSISSSHVPFPAVQMVPPGPRLPIPAHVQAALDKVRRGERLR